MKRRPQSANKRSSNTRAHASYARASYARALIRVAKSEGVRQLKLGEFECVLAADDETEAIGFEVPAEGEREWEPEETRRRKRKGRGGT